jgi:hypothetical protein
MESLPIGCAASIAWALLVDLGFNSILGNDSQDIAHPPFMLDYVPTRESKVGDLVLSWSFYE